MKVRINASLEINKKIQKRIQGTNIEFADEGDYNLVEKGYDIPVSGISLVFNSIDYLEAVEFLINAMSDDGLGKKETFLIGYNNEKYTIIKTEDVQYIETIDGSVKCITLNHVYYLNKPLYYYETMFEEEGFFRINKSQIVNLLNVKHVVPWFNSRLVLTLDQEIQVEVSKKYGKDLRKKLLL